MSLKKEDWTCTGVGKSPTVELANYYSMSIRGAFVGTIALERSFDPEAADSSFGAVESFTAVAERTGNDPAGATYRFNCTAYTSGSPVCTLVQ